MNNFWQQVFAGNTVRDWLIAILIIVIGFTVLGILRKWVIVKVKKWAEKTASSLDDIIIAGINHSVIPMLYVLVLDASVNYLDFPEKIMKKVTVIFWVIIMFFILRIITSYFKYFIFSYLGRKDKNDIRQKQAKGLVLILTVSIWITGFIFLLDNLGFNIGTLIAGLGIGGIAVALAAQNILGDLFSYFVIFFDKPFQVGDFIGFDDKSGTVEYIGIKNTRIRTVGDDQLVCSNKDLTNSRVHNYGLMRKRRVIFNVEIVYQVSALQLKRITEIVKNIIRKEPGVELDRGHLTNFGNSGLQFEFVYFILSPDYLLYMNTHQKVLLNIFETFEKENIRFAYPTQTLFVRNPRKMTELISS